MFQDSAAAPTLSFLAYCLHPYFFVCLSHCQDLHGDIFPQHCCNITLLAVVAEVLSPLAALSVASSALTCPHGMFLVQVWSQTKELQLFKARRFKLTLDEALADVLRKLADQALAANISPNFWMHHGSPQNAELRSEHAHSRIKQLKFQSQVKRLRNKPSISSIPLVITSDGIIHDPDVLPMLPPQYAEYWTSGPLANRQQPQWSGFFTIDFENAQILVRKAGSCGGIYQIWLSRRELQPDGSYKVVMRTELYVGSAIGKHKSWCCDRIGLYLEMLTMHVHNNSHKVACCAVGHEAFAPQNLADLSCAPFEL